ncbi:F0F1 ATP synthase subunit epsilon [Propionimicrobium lymphophilum]|uniref:ATP synthase epsilon chain n=1 Tax=Propionimicrobium lymphophilum ACS-093-V-SCH5 TaxID=883161 RepID=S2WY89_9ACTN|nr:MULTISPECIES: F0F1 ATP synthase subunit epsilon [Propionimicrobium]EPD32689.1 ATP synthase F1, epsilon subunit [Propionimicrobium lymphophilum ACS-093-V-SCH5]ETJ98156.1 ATP synthase F1, epsilon subunit [Propionimicrobium sp. BV2F7]MDK7709311.1 F0F1 ATP synthase subunit epsilon [Propionimicrobium lymphophilum]MDK7733299.1 F0F1 ATP synthase subunit epsilon [Propionimicrobium lymphophilum]
MAEPLNVRVVSNDSPVWEGEATSVVVRTTEGDLGILSGHEPLMAILVPQAAEVLTVQGEREIFAISGGFVSIFKNRVSLICPYGELAKYISVEEAEKGKASLYRRINNGHATNQERMAYDKYVSQLRAARKWAGKND